MSWHLDCCDRVLPPPSPQEAAYLDYIAAANPAAVSELLDRIEAAEKARESWKGLAQQFGNELDTVRAKHFSSRLRHVIQWLRNGCDPMKAADELEMLAAAPEAKP